MFVNSQYGRSAATAFFSQGFRGTQGKNFLASFVRDVRWITKNGGAGGENGGEAAETEEKKKGRFIVQGRRRPA